MASEIVDSAGPAISPPHSNVKRPSSSNSQAEPGFEDALAALEAIVAKIESSELPLEEMIQGYEEGTRLLRVCEARIAAARQRVEKIARASADGVETEPFGTPAADPATAPNEELF